MDALRQDLRHAVRLSLRTPGVTAIAILALALGIGANTAIFTVVNAVLLDRLPYHDASRIVTVWESSPRRPGRPNSVGPANFLRWRERQQVFNGLAAFVDTPASLTDGGEPEDVGAQYVSEDFLSVLGVVPSMGRPFVASDFVVGQDQVVLLSHALWARRFGGDARIVGRAIQVNGRPMTVVGVMPPDFGFYIREGTNATRPAALWRPFVMPPEMRRPHGRFMGAIARLRPGVDLAQANAAMATIAAGLATELPEFDTGWSVVLVPLRDWFAGPAGPALLVLSGAVAFVLLIACANVANLLLARGAARRREVAVRTALGATRGRVVRQFLAESLMLAGAGGLLGLLLAEWGVAALVWLSPIDLSAEHVAMNRAVLGYTMLVSALTAVLAGLAPAFEASRTDVQEAMQDGARQAGGGARARRLRHAFVIGEVALAVVLLVGAGLMLRSFAALRGVGLGFDAHNVLTARVSLPAARYGDDEKVLAFFRDAEQRIRALPGVTEVGSVSFLPLASLGAATSFTVVGQPVPPPGQNHVTDVRVADTGYFAAMKLPLVAGRWFTEVEQREKRNVVLINEALAREYFRGQDPLGQRLLINMTEPIVANEVVGVVADAVYGDASTPVRPMTYWPHPLLVYSAMTFTVRTASDPLALAPAIEQQIHAIDREQPVADVRTMEQWVGRSLAQARFSSVLLATFAAMALLLASIGIFGLMSYAVTQRTGEIGVRLALGAVTGDIIRMVVRDGARIAGIGLALGVALALALTRTMSAMLYETTPSDPLTFMAVVVGLAAVALLASYLPARRASRITPTEALRCQ